MSVWDLILPPEFKLASNLYKAGKHSAITHVKEEAFNAADKVSNSLGIDFQQLLSQFGTSIETALSSSAQSAIQAEKAAAAAANKFASDQADRAMKFEAEQAKISRDWNERMSNSAYQRAVVDLKKAGLNPILAYTQGPASSPSSASASGFAASAQKADVSGGKNADLNTVSVIINSAASLLAAVGEVIPG